MKQRITALDLTLLTSELADNILNYRLLNIYNVAAGSRQYLLKFAVPDSKKVMVLDCGNKVHLTDFARQATEAPSNFVTKLRKHLKTRRLSGIKQIGNDRVLVLEFSDGLYYLVLEFFSAGNILLLDDSFKILSLQRMVNDKGDNDRYAVNEHYKMFDKTLFSDTAAPYENKDYSVKDIQDWIAQHKAKVAAKGDSKKNKVFSIHKLLFVMASHLSSDLIKKTLEDEGIAGSSSCLQFENDIDALEGVVRALRNTEQAYVDLLSNKDNLTGYIVLKRNPGYTPSEDDKEDLSFVYDEFHPFKPYKLNADDYKFEPVQGYNKTLDKFFSTLESTKFALRIEQKKQQAKNRLEHSKEERDKQIQALVAQQELNSKKGDAIIYFADTIAQCQEMIKELVNQQMDWTNIESVVKLEQSRNNEVAKNIKLPLKLAENKINVLLDDVDTLFDDDNGEQSSSDDSSESDLDSSSESESESESESDDSDSDSDSEDEKPPKKKAEKKAKSKKAKSKKATSQKLSCWIDLDLSPYANAALYFDTKKVAETKQVKVEKNTTMALKNAERKIQQDLAKTLKEEHDTLKEIRPKYWFEKFFWFVTSDGYLCLAGRDNLQVDMIYFRHFNDNDYMVSSDVKDSLKVFVKNPFKDAGIPPSTLWQAGIYAMSASVGWNGKQTTSAWCIPGPLVSKKDYDGSLIPPGEFNFKGKKDYMPPVKLTMGFGFYLLGDKETAAKYENIRTSREEQHGLKIVMNNKKKDLENAVAQAAAIATEEKHANATEKEEESEQNRSIEGDEQQESERTPEKESADDESINSLTQDTQGLNLQKKGGTPTNVRGKKSKMKKIATKYADQDEEERLMRMEALGTLKQVEDMKKQKEQEAQAELEKERKKYQQSAALQRRKKEEAREYQKYLLGDNSTNEDESSVMDYLSILDAFIARPATGDKVVNVVPVFAPWASMNKFKYKVKIEPGEGKKGKAIKDIIAHFKSRKVDTTSNDIELDWPAERELIESAQPNDLVGVFTVSKVKAMFGSGANSGKGKGGGSGKGGSGKGNGGSGKKTSGKKKR